MFKIQNSYNQVIRKAIVTFGNMFSDLTIKTKEADGDVIRNIEVPITYARKQQWLQRLQGDPDFQKKFEVVIPRLSFEIVGYQYLPEKKIGNQHDKLVQFCGLPKAIGAPVPYRLTVALSSYCKTTDDSLQILEQILPYFSPTLTASIELIPEYNFKTDIPVTLVGVDEDDNYQDINNNRMIIQTFTFNMDVQLFGPIDTSLGTLIKKVDVNVKNIVTQVGIENYHAAVNPLSANKEDTYSIDELWTPL
jgi:hypothetical protein